MKTFSLLIIFCFFGYFQSYGQNSFSSISNIFSDQELKSGEMKEVANFKLKRYGYTGNQLFVDTSETWAFIAYGDWVTRVPLDVISLKGWRVEYAFIDKMKGGSYYLKRINIDPKSKKLNIMHEKGKKMFYIDNGDWFPHNDVQNWDVKENGEVKSYKISEAILAGNGVVYESDNLIITIKKTKDNDHYMSIKKRIQFECKSGDCENGEGELNCALFNYKGSFTNGKPNGNGTLRSWPTIIKNKSEYLMYEGEFKDGQITGKGKVTLVSYSKFTIYEGAMKNGLPHGKGTYTAPRNEDFAYLITKKWSKNYTTFFQGFKNKEQLTLSSFQGEFVDGIPTGNGNIKISSMALGNLTEFAGNVTFANGEIQKPYSMEALKESPYSSYQILGKNISGKAKFTLKDGVISAPIKLTTYNGDLTIKDFEITQDEEGENIVIIKEIEGNLGYNNWVKTKLSPEDKPIGSFFYKQGEDEYSVEDYKEGEVGKGKVKKYGFSYEGEVLCKENQLYITGKGKKTLTDGTVEEGKYKDGVLVSGSMQFDDGGTYEGEYNSAKQFHGQGTQTWSSGAKYVGSFENGNRHGQGTYTYPSGNKYEGNWAYGKRSGKGKFTYKNGDYYEGSYSADEEVGEGFLDYHYSNGYYKGQAYNGNPKGQGTFVFPNGDSYTGEMNGLPNGQGTMKYADGSTKTGRFRDGKYAPYGPCTCTFEDDGDGNNIAWYNARLVYSDGERYVDMKVTVKESSSENREYEYWSFKTEARGYYYRWIWDDITEARLIPPYNQKGQIKTNYKGGGNVKIGYTTDDELAVKKMLEHIFRDDCSKVTHDY